MRFSDVFAASLVAPLVAAHGGDIPGAPKLFGMPRNLRARNPWAGHHNVGHAAGAQLQARQGGDANNRCGPDFNGATCATGYCCSDAGYCGTTKDHCAAPDCKFEYGPGCDANKTPCGATTKNDARSQLGSIEYGGWGIRECLKPGTVAITYDDGPYIYTEGVMEQFEARQAHATFFITGNNIGKGAIDEKWSDVIKKMYANGHQIASHTWSHQNLDLITSAQRFDQMVKNEMALRNIIGKYPTYMRPPYSACITQPCMDDMKTLGYVITSFDIDTDDYNQLSPDKIQIAKDNFKKGLELAGPNGDGLAIAHDIHEITATNLTAYMLDYIYSNGYKAVTVGECMNDPVENWYRDSAPGGSCPSTTTSSSISVPTPTGPASIDGQCGTANNGQTCIGFVGPDGISECCSAAGWCGRSSDHCGTGCNPLFGKCGTQPSISATPSVSVSQTSAAPVPTVSLPTSSEGDCGATAGKTCKGFLLNGVKAECCSQYNYCGNTEAYCGADSCNPLYGNCGSSVSSSSASASVSQVSSSASASQVSSSASVSQVSSSASVSRVSSASVSASVSQASSSASASVSQASSASISRSASSSASASVSKSASISSSAATQKTSSASASASVSKSATSSASASVSKSATSSASVSVSKSASSTAGVSASISKSSSASASKSDSKSLSSTPVPSSSASKSDVKSASSTPVVTSSSSPIGQPSSTPVKTSSFSPIGQPSSTPVKTSSFSPIGQPSPTTFGTVVKPSSTPCDDDKPTPTPTPTGPPVSKDGKCGKDNGGQTCAGYKNPFGQTIECCCKESGRCSTDPWACGVGCDPKFGKCNKY